MRTSGFSDGIETFQAVRDHLSAGRRMLPYPSGDVPIAETVDHGELNALQMSLIISLHDGHTRCLATGPASAITTTSLATQIGFIHLHQTRQTLFLTAFEHHLDQFVLHPPGHIVGNAQLSIQLHRRDAFFGQSQKVDRLELDRRRQFAGFKDGAGDNTDSTDAVCSVEVTALVMDAVRTDDAVRLTQHEQRLEAFLFVATMFQEGTEAEAILELDRISFHVMYSFFIKYLRSFTIPRNILIISGN